MDKTISDVKLQATREIGSRMDDRLEAAEQETHALGGAVQMLKQAAQNIESLHAHVGKDMDAHLFADLTDVQVQAQIKRYIDRAIGVVQNLQLGAEQARLKAMGKQEALQQAVKLVKQLHDQEVARVARIEKIEADGGIPETLGRVVGDHPGDPLADRRAEAVAPEAPKTEDKPETPTSDNVVAEDVGG
jgi:hypothetical protein